MGSDFKILQYLVTVALFKVAHSNSSTVLNNTECSQCRMTLLQVDQEIQLLLQPIR